VTGTVPQTAMERALRGSRLLVGLDDAILGHLARSAVRRSYARGDFLWRAGEQATNFTIIVSGLVKICRPRREGPSAIVGLFGPRESVGDVAVVSRESYPADAIAASDHVELLCIEKTSVLSVMDRDFSMMRAVNRSLVEHSHALHEKIRIMTAGSVDRRLQALLDHLAERFGDEQEDGTLVVPIVLSRTELACLVGATVETTIRVLSRWQKAGLLSTTSEGFVIHRPLDLEIGAEEA
jgi:CRP-like cAMP-binding protein